MAADPERPGSGGGSNPGDAFEDLKRRRADATATQQMFALSGIGFEFVAEVGGLTLIGWWLDRTFETSPWCTIAGVILGFSFGLYRLVKFGKRTMK